MPERLPKITLSSPRPSEAGTRRSRRASCASAASFVAAALLVGGGGSARAGEMGWRREPLPALAVERPPLMPYGWSSVAVEGRVGGSGPSATTTVRHGWVPGVELWGALGGGPGGSAMSWDDPCFGARVGASAEPPLRAGWLGLAVTTPTGGASDRSSGAAFVTPEAGAAWVVGSTRLDAVVVGAWAPIPRGAGAIVADQGLVSTASMRVNGGPIVPRAAVVVAVVPEPGATAVRWEYDAGALLDLSRGLGLAIEARGFVAGAPLDAVGPWRASRRQVATRIEVRW